MTMIACVDHNWAIGYENRLLFHIPDDLAHFKRTTMGHVLLMGRKTYDSLPQLLPGREHVVLSRDVQFEPCGVHVCRSLDEVVRKAKSLGKVFVAGGAEIYDTLLPQCNTAFITQVDIAVERADAFFPNLDAQPDWDLTKAGEWRVHDGLTWRICEYNRQNCEFQQNNPCNCPPNVV